jgi:hypothetical protein
MEKNVKPCYTTNRNAYVLYQINIIRTNFKVLTLQSLEGYVGTLERERKVEGKGVTERREERRGMVYPSPFLDVLKIK